MIAALLQELEERHGLSAADGIQLLSRSALLERPWDPGWPLVIVPAVNTLAAIDRSAVMQGVLAAHRKPPRCTGQATK